MTAPAAPVKMTTPGEWVVGTTVIKDSPDRRRMIGVVCADDPSKIVGLFGVEGAPDENESIANAALFAVSKNMLDLIIHIQEKFLDPNINEIDISELDRDISTILAKLANEAGEEL